MKFRVCRCDSRTDKNVGVCLYFRGIAVVAVVVQVLSSGIGLADYAMPIGVPKPSFGIDESHMMYTNRTYNFGSGLVPYPDAGNGPYTHYIDTTHANSTDAANPYGSPLKPRKSWPTYLAAGSVVELHGGVYDPQNFYKLSTVIGSGTAESPIFFRGVSTNQRPVLINLTTMGQYIIFENLAFTGTCNIYAELSYLTTTQLVEKASHHHIVIRDNIFTGHGNEPNNGAAISGIGGWDATTYGAGTSVSHVVVLRNEISNYGSLTNAVENDWVGVAVNGYGVSNVWVMDNAIYKMASCGVRAGSNEGSANRADGKYIYISRNLIYSNREQAVAVKQINDVIVSENTMYHYYAVDSSPGVNVVILYDPYRVWVMFNRMSDANYGVISSGCSNLYVIGNVLYDIHHSATNWDAGSAYSSGGAIHVRNSQNTRIIGNTIFDYDTGVQIPNGTVEIVNNLFVQRAVTNALDINYLGPTNGLLDYNLFYTPTCGSRITWSGYNAKSVAQLQQLTKPIGIHQIAGVDPALKAPTLHDFHPASTSRVLDAGCEHVAYDTYQALYGVSIKKDIEGRSRPQGAKWDIGAYEVLPETTSKVPRSPTGVRVTSP